MNLDSEMVLWSAVIVFLFCIFRFFLPIQKE